MKKGIEKGNGLISPDSLNNEETTKITERRIKRKGGLIERKEEKILTEDGKLLLEE